jgi:tetratricopeptide (TPR) repeat protein
VSAGRTAGAGPTIVSMTLVGPCRDIGQAALRSVLDWVDRCLLIDTGAGDGSMEMMVALAGPKAVTAAWTWNGDFAAARNFALDQAQLTGADWAVTVDPDERIHADGAALRAFLGQTPAGCVLIPDTGRTYFKERLFRLPCPVRFHGPVHESFAGYRIGAARYAEATFDELPKSAETLRAKTLRDVEMLQRHTRAVPDEPRWFYYLGDGLQRLGRLDEAVEAYRSCQALRGWAEEAAWACYRAAECELARQRFDAAVEWCATGLVRHPGVAELPWLAAVACWRAGRPADAVAWARMSEALGRVNGAGAGAERIGFHHPPAQYEGPYDVLRFALAALGDTEGAGEAERRYVAARRRREQLSA